ncbi:MAG: hypothetical protein A3H97_00290 [Acidobacteria bacterium RIFCSPLOWO2_02_FULL_65_29]|nr:MAG: hypothetical protein A3H97_00290 [Acidobacteria bacterium RIFCSPLOWO2_02_FULL_65_29]
MTLLLQVVAFALGIYLSIRMIAALHGIADFWYMIDKAWLRVLAGVLAWGTTIGVVAWLMARPYQTAFVWGLLTYLVFYLSLLPLARLYVAGRRTDRYIEKDVSA